MAVISEVALIRDGCVVGVGGGNRDPVRKKISRGAPSFSHMPNKPPHQSQTTIVDEANV